MRLSLSICLLACWTAYARADVVGIEQAIVGGDVLSEQVVSPTALMGTCDATLVAPGVLLTAAHCTWDEPERAWFGASQRAAVLELEISHCVRHPDFEAHPEGNDIALCFLRGDTSLVEPAALGELEVAANSDVTLVGHGYTGTASDERVVRAVDVRVAQARNGELLVGDREHGACHGDSGGSAFMETEGGTRLVGVISRRGPSADGGTCASTTLLTALHPHLGWVTQNMTPSDGCALQHPAGASWLVALALLLAIRRRTGSK